MYLRLYIKAMLCVLQEPPSDEVEMCPSGLASVQAISRKLAAENCTGKITQLVK